MKEVVPKTQTIELQELTLDSLNAPSNAIGSSSQEGSTRSKRDLRFEENASETVTGVPIPEETVEELEKWNEPRHNMYRTLSAFWALLVMGMNDAAYGALIPYLEIYYDLSYTVVSLVFLSPFIGYTAAAFLNNTIHMKFGQRGIAFLAPICKILAYTIIAIHPPYPALVVMYLFAGLGNGFEDAAWNAWIGPMANSNEVLGLLHGCYGLGATVSPLIATAMITKGNLQWYTFYYIMIAVSAVELASSLFSFWTATGAAFRLAHPQTTDKEVKGTNRMKESLFTLPSARVTWLCAFFFLGYVGTEVAIGGWVVTFMLKVRDGSPFSSGLTETGFWLGITMGRVLLGFITGRIGNRLAIAIYLPLCTGLLLLFWLIPSFIASAIAVSFIGFFMGPLFPTGVAVATRLLPKHLHVAAIGFAVAFGGTGGAFFPFAVGAIAQKAGVKVLQPIVLGMFVVLWGLWMGLPNGRGKEE